MKKIGKSPDSDNGTNPAALNTSYRRAPRCMARHLTIACCWRLHNLVERPLNKPLSSFFQQCDSFGRYYVCHLAREYTNKSFGPTH
jgi:hypothetical protein